MHARLLVVDDNHTVRRIVARVLQDAGYDVVEAADGAEALEASQHGQYDLALVDFVMPKLNGYQLVQAMRAIPALRTLPVVLMSAKAEQIGDRFMRQTGSVDAITKPFAPEALLAVVTHALLRDAGNGAKATLVNEEMRSRTSRIPPPQDAASDNVDVTNPSLMKPTMRDLGPAAERIAQQLETSARIAETLLPLVTPLLERAARGDASGPDAVVEALTIALDAAQLGSLFEAIRGWDGARPALEGDLALVPLGEVFQMLRLQQQTGLLVADHDPAQATVAFRGGNVEVAVVRGASSEFLLGRYLVADGVITRDELQRHLSSAGGWLGERLVSRKAITAEDLNRVLTRQTCEIVYEMLRWTTGRFRFEQGKMLAEADQARLGLPIETMVLEGFRRVDEWRLIEDEIHSFDDVILRDTMAVERVGEGLANDERNMLEHVDGRRTVRDIVIASAMSSFDACRILHRLLSAKLLRRRA